MEIVKLNCVQRCCFKVYTSFRKNILFYFTQSINSKNKFERMKNRNQGWMGPGGFTKERYGC